MHVASYFFCVVGSTVRIYSANTGKVVSTLSTSSAGSSASRNSIGEGHADTITSVVLNPENPFQLLTSSLDGCIKVWDFLDAVLLQTIDIGEPITYMCVHDRFKGHVFAAALTKTPKPGIKERELQIISLIMQLKNDRLQ
jgi:NET1-associated nuclear protein 1 (U3 small nucleolar RNA-associated protein 17)